jgi:hypothetical protein
MKLHIFSSQVEPKDQTFKPIQIFSLENLTPAGIECCTR